MACSELHARVLRLLSRSLAIRVRLAKASVYNILVLSMVIWS
jgi:hypothetical protein